MVDNYVWGWERETGLVIKSVIILCELHSFELFQKVDAIASAV